MGRPKIEIDPNQVEILASLFCSHEEIAAVIGCSQDTIERRFADVIKRGRDKGKSSLKKWQFDAAKKGNTAMLIWLGKQHLGQREPINFEMPKNTNVTLKYKIDD